MKRHTIIEINRFTNFLNRGAFVRRQGIWTLLLDPSESELERSTSTIKTDYLTSMISRKHYRNQWDMSNSDWNHILDQTSESLKQEQEKIIINWLDIDKIQFEKAFDLSQNAIANGEVKKVVPIACQKGRLKESLSLFNKLYLLKKLSNLPGQLYPYGEWDETSGFMGASPELFLKVNQSHIETMALAGTSGKEVDPLVFLNDPKERKEHQFVVDDIVEQLSDLARVEVEPTRVIQLPTLNHLETKITAKLNRVIGTENLILKLHPTSALGIYPRGAFFKTFCQFPYQKERGLFGAPWGLESEEGVFLLVAIRKLDWLDNDVRIFAGCGVVQESSLEKEFAEITKKIDSVKRIFFKD